MVIVPSSELTVENGGGEYAEAESEKNDEKMALQSIYETAFTEKIPGGLIYFFSYIITSQSRYNIQ